MINREKRGVRKEERERERHERERDRQRESATIGGARFLVIEWLTKASGEGCEGSAGGNERRMKETEMILKGENTIGESHFETKEQWMTEIKGIYDGNLTTLLKLTWMSQNQTS